MKPVKVGVIGIGNMGWNHARVLSLLRDAELVGVADPDATRGALAKEQFSCEWFADYNELIQQVEAVCIAVPTLLHHPVGMACLRAGVHVLIEKPIAANEQEAVELIAAAKQAGRLLQVGHIERFNPAFRELLNVMANEEVVVLEGRRHSPNADRANDVSVVLDLMIHDLDIVLSFVDSPVEHVDAAGVRVLSQSEDIANARLRFANGCVANLTVSRVSPEQMRKIRVFSGGDEPSYVSLDYREQKGYYYRLAREGEQESSFLKKLLTAKDSPIVSQFGGKRVVREPVPIEREEPLKVELESFVHCVEKKQAPVVTGESARQAIELALEITRQIQEQAD